MSDANDDDYDDDEIEDVTGFDFALQTVLFTHLGLGDDDPRGEIDLSLVIGGVIVRGTAVPERRYADRVKSLFRDPSSQESMEMIFGFEIEQRSQMIKEREAADLPAYARKFVHMIDATIVTGGAALEVPVYRGYLDEVSGWAFGGYMVTGAD